MEHDTTGQIENRIAMWRQQIKDHGYDPTEAPLDVLLDSLVADVRALALRERGCSLVHEHGVQLADGEVLGPIDDFAGYQRGELRATHKRDRLRVADLVEDWKPIEERD